MGGLLLLGAGTYLAIMVAVWIVNSAYAEGGILAIIGLILWFVFWIWVASGTCNKGKK